MNNEAENPNLRLKLENIENKQHILRKEIDTLNKEIKLLKVELSETQPRRNKFIDYIRRLRNNFGPMFIGLIIFFLSILASLFLITSNLVFLTLSIGFIIFLVTSIIKEKKYAPVSILLIVAIILFLYSTYLAQTDIEKWNYNALGLAIIAIGLALQSLLSGENIENKLNDIDSKVSRLENNSSSQQRD